MLKPKDSTHEKDGSHYKVGRHGLVYRWSPEDGWLNSGLYSISDKYTYEQIEIRAAKRRLAIRLSDKRGKEKRDAA